MFLVSGMIGKDVVEKMLYDNGIYDVCVISILGMLIDYYNLVNKMVNFSEGVYGSNSVVVVVVVVYECGYVV